LPDESQTLATYEAVVLQEVDTQLDEDISTQRVVFLLFSSARDAAYICIEASRFGNNSHELVQSGGILEVVHAFPDRYLICYNMFHVA
jgi:hypothetical protein